MIGALFVWGDKSPICRVRILNLGRFWRIEEGCLCPPALSHLTLR